MASVKPNKTNNIRKYVPAHNKNRNGNLVAEREGGHAVTGLYYYGARYLDPKTSRWLAGDPAMGEYFPSAPVNDEAKKRNGNLPGQGGVFNYVNLHAYHYAGNNPVLLIDPDGRSPKDFIAKLAGAAVTAVKSLLQNDNSSVIHTAGISASGTVTMVSGSVGVGVYINPKNEKMHTVAKLLSSNPVTAALGVVALAINIEEAGVYANASAGVGIGISGSVSLTEGTYVSREMAQGPYLEGGGSAGFAEVSAGLDVATTIRGESVIGASGSIGIGVGTPEAHARAGVTGFLPIIKKENE